MHTSSASPAPESRFSDRVANYVRFRPGYPAEVLEILRRETGLGPESVVGDIGSGTGISSAMLLQSGCTLYAVEPNADMRGAAEQMLSGEVRFYSVTGSAEATTLPEASLDLVTAAQAFHWFKPEPTRVEFTRILKPDGWVALVWNVRKVDGTPFLHAYENLLLDCGTDYSQVRHENIGLEQLGGFFKGGAYTTFVVPHAQQFDFEGLKGRLLSSSYAPAPGHPRHEAMLTELEEIFEKTNNGGSVAFEYDTQVFIGK